MGRGEASKQPGGLLRSATFPKGSSNSNPEALPSLATQSADSSPVIHLVTDAKGNVLHEVHVRMQELPIAEAKSPDTEVGAAPGGRGS